jgi:lysophospholipase L1-like esterase
MINCILGVGDSLTYMLSGYYWRTANGGSAQVDAGGWPSARYGVRQTNGDRIHANYAFSGWRLTELLSEAIKVDALLTPANDRNYILSVLIGTNVSDANPTTFAASVGAYCQARASAGWTVILGTMPSRTDGAIANFETSYQQPYNAIIKGTGWASANGVSRIADYAAVPEIGAAGAADNATYFADKIHPTAAGYSLMYEVLADVLNDLTGAP